MITRRKVTPLIVFVLLCYALILYLKRTPSNFTRVTKEECGLRLVEMDIHNNCTGNAIQRVAMDFIIPINALVYSIPQSVKKRYHIAPLYIDNKPPYRYQLTLDSMLNSHQKPSLFEISNAFAYKGALYDQDFNYRTKYFCQSMSDIRYPNNTYSRMYKNVVYIADVWDENYYHFLVEQFTRLFIVKELIPNGEYDAVITYKKMAFKVDYLKWLYPNAEIVYMEEEHQPLFFKKVVLPQGTKCAILSTQIISLMHKHIVYLWKDHSVPNIVVIKRKPKPQGPQRIIANHDALMSKLRLKFKEANIVEFYEHDPLETISIFSSADIIIAGHGAGISNIIFAKPGFLLIEIMEEESYHHFNFCFFDAAMACGGEYQSFLYQANVVDVHEIANSVEVYLAKFASKRLNNLLL